MDSGASRHVAPEGQKSASELKTPVVVETTAGEVSCTELVRAEAAKPVGPVECLRLENSPHLLSLGQLVLDDEYDFEWYHGKPPVIRAPSESWTTLDVENRVPVLRGDAETERVFAGVVGESHDLTHLPADPDCPACALGKLRRAQARTLPEARRNRATAFLEKVHADCVGPSLPSVRHNKYLVVFRCDFSGFAWAVPVKQITAASILHVFKRVFPETRPMPLTVRADGGAEFKGVFDAYCIEKGIVVERGLPRTPQTRSRGERFHGILNDGIRASLARAGMPVEWWDFAAAHWVVNYNCTANQSRHQQVAMVVAGRTVPTRVFTPFGCLAAVYDPRPRAAGQKFAGRAIDAVVVGYATNKGFQLVVLADYEALQSGTRSTVHIFYSRNVRLYQTVFPSMRMPRDKGYPHFDLFGPGDLPPVEEGEQLIVPEEPSHLAEMLDESPAPLVEDDPGGLPDDTARILTEAGERQAAAQTLAEECVGSGADQTDSPANRARRQPSSVGFAPLSPSVSELDAWLSEMRDDAAVAQAPSSSSFEPNPDAVRRIRARGEEELARSVRRRLGSESPDEPRRGLKRTASQPSEDQRDRDPFGFSDQEMSSVCRVPTNSKALVVRWIMRKDAEWHDPKAGVAIRKESDNLADKGVWTWCSVREWDDVKKLDPGAHVCGIHIILGIKNSEMPEADRIWKARIVAGGHNVRDTDGKKAEFEQLFGSPINIGLTKVVLFYAILNDYVVEVADVEGAYLTSPLRGTAVWARVPLELRPADWKGRYKNPVVRLQKALYGLSRSGFDWYDHFQNLLFSEGWEEVPEHHSLYWKGSCILASYVDDILLAGPAKDVRKEWAIIQKTLRLKAPPEKLNKFVGIDYKLVVNNKFERHLTISQVDYAKLLVTRFLEDKKTKSFAKASVPTPSKQRMDEWVHTPVEELMGVTCTEIFEKHPEKKGVYEECCRKHIGGLLFLARGSRPDLSFAVMRLAKKSARLDGGV